HLLDATPSIVMLLEDSPWLKVLVTSREALHVRGERRYPVPPLRVPPASKAYAGGATGARSSRFQVPGAAGGLGTLEELAGYPSVELFIARAQDNAPDFELTAKNAQE